MRRRITLIHATPVAIEPIARSFRESWPEAEVYNLLEDSLAPDLERAGELDPGLFNRFAALSRYAADCGSDGILFTCSAFGAAIDAAAEELQPIPVLKPNEAMFRLALERGEKIGMVATFEPAIASMAQEFDALAAQLRPGASLKTLCAEGAMQALRDGNTQLHNQRVVEAAAALVSCDLVMLAHFSTSRALADVSATIDRPVLSSPDSAVDWLRRNLA